MKYTFIKILNESTSTDKPVLVDKNHPIETIDTLILPTGTSVNMHIVNTILRDAVDTLGEIVGKSIRAMFSTMPFIYDTTTVHTMATDGEYIYINPGFVMHLYKQAGNTVEYVAYVLLHEMFHAVLDHTTDSVKMSGDYPDSRRVNRAQDYLINYMIEHCVPDTDGEYIFKGATDALHGCIDDKFAGKDWPQIYPQISSSIKKDDRKKIETSQAFKDGIKKGIENKLRELRAQGKIK